MDYDDNDFQGQNRQNLHIAGEGSSKVSPVLRPYDLPKFDFDDSLQGHLRFDSLVENEVFLGIASQEDNQWIEEFSRGSSGIEFSSSAAESCSISRRNNVWSEATSSESVEMLLKSVGQEERALGETIVEESDAGDELGSLTKNMDPNLNQGDGKDHVMHSQDALPLDEFPENFSELNHVKLTSQSQEAELSGCELDRNVVSEKCGLSVTEENNDGKYDDVNQREVDNLVNESLDDKMQEDPSVSGMQLYNTESLQNVNASVEELNDQENPKQVSEICIENANVRSKEAKMDDQMLSGTTVETCTYDVESSLCVVSKVESADNHSAEITSLRLMGDCETQIAEGYDVGVCSAKPSQGSQCAVMVSSNCSQINEQPYGNMHEESPAAFLGDGSFEVHAIEVGNTKAEIVDCPELNTGSLSQISLVQSCPVEETENAPGSDDQEDNPSTSMVSVLGNNHVGTSLMTACYSAELVAGKISTENLIAGDNAPEVHNEDSNAEDRILPPMLSGSMQVHNENPSSEPGDICVDSDLSFHVRGDSKLSMEGNDMECEVVDSHKNVVSLSPGEGSERDIVIGHGSESDTTTQTEAVSIAAVEETNFASRDTLDADIVIDDQPKSPILGVSLSHLDDKDNMEVKFNTEEASSLIGTQHVASVLDPISEGPTSEVENGASRDSTEQVLHEMVDHSAPMVENCNASLGEQAVEDNKVGQESSKKLEVGPIPFDSSAKEGDDGEAVGLENPKEMMAERNHRVEHLKLAVDLSNDHQASVDLARPSECDTNHVVQDGGNSSGFDETHCDSPTVISCIELSQSTNDKQEGVKGAMIENVPFSKVTDDVEGKSQSISPNVSENSASKGERSFTFEVSPCAGLVETGKGWQSFPTIQAFNLPTTVEGSSSKSGGGEVDPKMVQEISRGIPQEPGCVITQVGPEGTPEHKPRRKAARKESAKKGNHVKETTPARQLGRAEKSSVSLAPSATGQLVQFEEMKPYENVERSGTKPCGVISIPTSNLPDLNTWVPSFQQPFTDIQQVQLRAQIFVYGDLIKMVTPEEACMIAAFGQSDGGRSPWEPAWRLHGQKFQANNSDTPVQLHSELRDAGIRAPDQAIKHSSLQSKVLSSPSGRANSKGTPSPVVNPMIPLSSPLWNISTPTPSCEGLQSSGMPRSALLDYHQAISPLHAYQTPPVQNFAGQNPWISQGPFPGQWVASSPTSPFNVSARFSALPITEAVKLTPVKESGVSGIKHTSPIPVVHSGGTSVIAGASSLSEVKKTTLPSCQPSGDSKSRKRKKVPVIESLGQISLPAQTQAASLSSPVILGQGHGHGHGQISLPVHSQTESVAAPVVSRIFSTLVSVSTPACLTSKSSPGKFVSAVSPTSSIDHPRSGDQNKEKFIISEDTISKVAEAKVQAEDAAVHAAAAVSNCQHVWSQLERQRNSGSVSDIESKLASAAVSIAAAASVAKAAAAAAKIAANAAEQAKLMADEAFLSSGIISLPSVVNNFGKATPQSILKGGDGSDRSNSIIVAAREAARRRVEAASAASKHAENLDAIVKAAELAAEAVSQAGKIVAMGDPLPLSELVKSGPGGYWKTPQVPSSEQQGIISNNVNSNFDTKSVEAAPIVFARSGPTDKEIQTSKRGTSTGEISVDLMEDQTRLVNGNSGSITSHEKDLGGARAHRAFDLSKTIGVIPESEIGLTHSSVVGQNEYKNTSGMSKENKIKEGCLVEVFKDGGNFKAAWFAANVLSLKDGNAFVCYTELQSDEGSGQLKEWVPLDGEGTKVPRIRIAHPTTTMRFEGTRKRLRASVTDYAWSVGDRVDAWIQDCWREGVVTEKNKNDETSLTVQFPAQGETSVIRAWHVRPTLIWKDGEWIEWSTSKGDRSAQGDKPHEKRLKLGSPAVEGKGKEKVSKNVDLVKSGRQEESRLLPISAEENLFNVGKNTRDENKLDTHRTMRSGLQKEGPRVIFGVPKPGKKQKFMDVSKHYVADRSNKNNNAANDSVKFARYLMPQGSEPPRRWKNNSKTDNAKEKQVAETKSRVFKSGKPQNPSGRTLLAQKENFLTSTRSAPPRDAIMTDNIVKDSITDDKNESGPPNPMEFGFSTNTEDVTEGSILVSSLALPPRVPTSNAKSERLNKGKLVPTAGKSARLEVKDKSIPEIVEPRRSNRRIQPTSRLLEGLQSSLTISKIPAVTQDRSHRNQNRVTSKGNTNHG